MLEAVSGDRVVGGNMEIKNNLSCVKIEFSLVLHHTRGFVCIGCLGIESQPSNVDAKMRVLFCPNRTLSIPIPNPKVN